MQKKYLEAGEIVSTHGVQGEVKILPWADGPEFLLQFDTFYLDGRPYAVRSARVVTNRWLALPIFALVMCLVYYVSVTTVGSWATDWTNDGLFGDGWHLFGIGSSAYDDAINEYAEENIWTPAAARRIPDSP